MDKRFELSQWVDVNAGDPDTGELRLRLREAIERARRDRLAILTVRHAPAGPNRSATEKVLRELRLKWLVGGTINGVDFSESNYHTLVALYLHPELAGHPGLNRGDRGITLVFLGSRPLELPCRRFRFLQREGEQN